VLHNDTSSRYLAKKDILKERIRPFDGQVDHNVIWKDSFHSIHECRVFRGKSWKERRTLMKEKGICLRCCEGKHLMKDCIKKVVCKECQSDTHPTAMHIPVNVRNVDTSLVNKDTGASHGGEQSPLVVNCTEVCGKFARRSCAKQLFAC